MGSRDELRAANARARADDPAGEDQLYPRWQQAQYMLGMFESHHVENDDARYPGLRWTTLAELLASRAKSGEAR